MTSGVSASTTSNPPRPGICDIEEHHLRPVFADGLERRETIVRVALDQLEGVGREQLAQP